MIASEPQKANPIGAIRFEAKISQSHECLRVLTYGSTNSGDYKMGGHIGIHNSLSTCPISKVTLTPRDLRHGLLIVACIRQALRMGRPPARVLKASSKYTDKAVRRSSWEKQRAFSASDDARETLTSPSNLSHRSSSLGDRGARWIENSMWC